jgi:hypothetical protein
MDVLSLFKMVGQFFIRLCSVSLTVGGYEVSVGAIFVFCFGVGVLCKFIGGLSK